MEFDKANDGYRPLDMHNRYRISKNLYSYLNRVELEADFEKMKEERWKVIRELMNKMPANKMIGAINYIDSNLLPAVKRKSGDNSPDYLFFAGLIEILQYSIVLYDRMRLLENMHANLRLDAQLLRERVLLYEQELMKYSTAEDLVLADFLSHYEKGVRARAEAEWKRNKK
jgi:hypothetical protein